MPDFNDKMHQNRFWLGLCPRPRWGSLQRSPDPGLDLRGPRGRGGEERRGGVGRRGEGRGRSTCLPPRFNNPGYGPATVYTPLFACADRWAERRQTWVASSRRPAGERPSATVTPSLLCIDTRTLYISSVDVHIPRTVAHCWVLSY